MKAASSVLAAAASDADCVTQNVGDLALFLSFSHSIGDTFSRKRCAVAVVYGNEGTERLRTLQAVLGPRRVAGACTELAAHNHNTHTLEQLERVPFYEEQQQQHQKQLTNAHRFALQNFLLLFLLHTWVHTVQLTYTLAPAQDNSSKEGGQLFNQRAHKHTTENVITARRKRNNN